MIWFLLVWDSVVQVLATIVFLWLKEMRNAGYTVDADLIKKYEKHFCLMS